MRWLYRIVVFLFVALSGWLGYAGWKGAKLVETILTVGSPIAQGADAKSPTVPAEIGYIGDPRTAFGYAFEEVQVNSELGRNPAWLVPAAAPSGRHAIFVHGIGGRRENGYRFLPVLREAGFDTLMIAYRNDEGAPPSPDRKYSLGLNEWRDLKAAVETLQARGASTIVIVAESMGGAITGQYLANGAPPAAVKAIVLDAPMVDMDASLAALIGRLGIPLAGLTSKIALRIAQMRAGLALTDANVHTALAGYPGPVFLSHGSGDRLVPVATSDVLAKSRHGETVYVRTAADHILSWKADPAAYESRLREFLAKVK